MKKAELIELFCECLDNCSLDTHINIHNEFVREYKPYGENEIEPNDEEFFNLYFENRPLEAVRATYFGKYEWNDDYVWFNAYGNVCSGTYENELPLSDAEEMAEWFIEHYDTIDNIDEMNEFCEACESYDEFDEETEECEKEENE